jgi:hypothetical protein
MSNLKFTQVSRVICPKTGIHYLDAIDEYGNHWIAEQETDVEQWITYSQMWHEDRQQPVKLK